MTRNQKPPLQRDKRRAQLPTTDQLVQISVLLNDEPVPKVLSARKAIPRTLLTAAKRGINEDPASQVSGTKALVDSLLALSKASVIAKKRNQNVRKPSPFSRTRAAQLGKVEMETVSRAGAWATTLLTDCIRGASDPPNQSPPLASVAHASTAAVFVAPRDTLDPVLAQRYAHLAIQSLRHSFFRTNLSALTGVQAFLSSTAAVASRHSALYLPVLERALLTFASAPCPLLASEQSDRALEQALEESSGSPISQFESLVLLSPEAKGSLCVQSPLFLASLRADIEQVFLSRQMMSYATECETVNPLARAAAIDVNFHWEMMDHVRTLICGHEAPFSLHLWNQRRFFRALLSEILRIVGSGEYVETAHANIVRRFPSFGRPVIQHLSALSSSMRSQDVRRQRMAVRMAGKLVWKMLNLEEDIVWTPNVHALMICAESLLELFCWAATFSLELAVLEHTLPKKRKQSRGHDALMCMCYLTSLMETSRLPGGELVETMTQLQSTALATRNFIVQIYRKRQLDLAAAFREKRISGLNDFALSGILGRHEDVSLRCCEKVRPEDKESLSRSLEKSMLWTTDTAILSRYSGCLKTLTDFV